MVQIMTHTASYPNTYAVHDIGVDKSISSKLSSFPFPDAKVHDACLLGLGIAVGVWWLWLDLSTVG